MPAVSVIAPLLSVRDVSVIFEPRAGLLGARGARVVAVDGVSFDLAPGEALGIVGESGCGKSTLVRAILRLAPAAGTVRLEGADVPARAGEPLRAFRRKVQVVLQNPYDSLDPRMRVLTVVREPLDVHEPGLSRGERNERARTALGEVGLGPEFARRFPHELSGGQRQRVGIARALVLRPALLICDEPVSSLDISVQAQILELLAGLRARFRLAMILISHDVRVVRTLCDRALVLYRGRVMEAAPVGELFARPLHPYTRLLLESVPSLDPSRPSAADREPDGAGEGEPAEEGCPFAPRCPLVAPTCLVGRPELREARAGHWVACPVGMADNPDGRAFGNGIAQTEQ